jgi:hypothetical protein
MRENFENERICRKENENAPELKYQMFTKMGGTSSLVQKNNKTQDLLDSKKIENLMNVSSELFSCWLN